jgi:hypothetical protein
MPARGARKKKVCVRQVCVGRVCVGLVRERDVAVLWFVLVKAGTSVVVAWVELGSGLFASHLWIIYN